MSSTMIYNPQRIFLNSLNSENGITLKEKIQNALKLMDTLKRTDNKMNQPAYHNQNLVKDSNIDEVKQTNR